MRRADAPAGDGEAVSGVAGVSGEGGVCGVAGVAGVSGVSGLSDVSGLCARATTGTPSSAAAAATATRFSAAFRRVIGARGYHHVWRRGTWRGRIAAAMPRSSSRHHLPAASLLLVAASALLAACDAEAPAATSPAPPAVQAEPAKTGEAAKAEAAPKPKAKLAETKFGQPVSAGDTTQLSTIVADPAKFSGKTVKTEGVVKAVCQSAGCWMEIEPVGAEAGAARRAHVKMVGHSFYVPKNCDGHRAVIEGTVQGAPEDTCGAKDSCGGSENGALAKLEIAATGVEFVD